MKTGNIIERTLISYPKMSQFFRELEEIIDNMQNNGLVVEVQYRHSSNHLEDMFTALVFGREKITE